MWIKTKNKKTLIKVTRVSVVKSFGKYHITAVMPGQGSFDAAEEIGKYESETAADAEFRAIEHCIKEGIKFYEMK